MVGLTWPLHEIPFSININNRYLWVSLFNIKMQVGIHTNLRGGGSKLPISGNAQNWAMGPEILFKWEVRAFLAFISRESKLLSLIWGLCINVALINGNIKAFGLFTFKSVLRHLVICESDMINDKAITLMRGKSPQSDVQKSKN